VRFTRSKSLATTAAMLLGFGLAGAGTATAAHATTYTCNNTTGQTTIYYGNDHGWNNWNGSTSPGNPINFYQSLTANNSQWCAIPVGQVRDGQNGEIWPFTNGSGLNTRYNGDTVFQFEWAPNQIYCADQGAFRAALVVGPVELQSCVINGSASNQYFVQSGSDYLAPVGANNAEYAYLGTAYLPVLVGDGSAGSDSNGQPIYMADADQLQWNCPNC